METKRALSQLTHFIFYFYRRVDKHDFKVIYTNDLNLVNDRRHNQPSCVMFIDQYLQKNGEVTVPKAMWVFGYKLNDKISHINITLIQCLKIFRNARYGPTYI